MEPTSATPATANEHLATVSKTTHHSRWKRHPWFGVVVMLIGIALLLGLITTGIMLAMNGTSSGVRSLTGLSQDVTTSSGSAPSAPTGAFEKLALTDNGSGGAGIDDAANVIRNVSVTATVSNLDDAVTRVQTITKNAGGRVDNLSRSTNPMPIPPYPCDSIRPCPYYTTDATDMLVAPDSSLSSYPQQQYTSQETASLTIRVPADRVDAVKVEIKQLAANGKFDTEYENAYDVGKQKIDAQARLDAWRAERAALEQLMARAQSIDEIIRIREQLTNVQANIDSYQQQLDYLNDQTGMATINVTLNSVPVVPDYEAPVYRYDPVTRFKQAWNSLKLVGQRLLDVLIYTVVYLVILIPLALIIWLIRRALRRRPTTV